jgi:hypothetical protein
MGNQNAQKLVNGELSRLEGVSKDAKRITEDMGGVNVDQMKKNADLQGSIKTVRDELGNQNSALNEAVAYEKRFNEAKGLTGTTLDAQSTKLSALAGMYGTNVAALSGAQDAEKKTADQLALTTLQMQLQGNAAGLLKQAFDELNGKSLSLAQAQTAAAGATNSVTASFQQNGLAIEGGTAAAVANQQAIQSKVAADQASAEATAKATGSTQEGTKAYGESKTALENTMRSQGLLTDKVQAYIDKLYDVNNFKPKPVALDVNATEAELKLQGFQTAINNLTGKTVHIYSVEHIQQVRDGGDTATANAMNTANQYAQGNAYRAAGGPIYRAGGGLVNYLAGGGIPQFKPVGTDTVPAMLTPEEFVVNRASAKSLGLPALNYMNQTGQLPPQGSSGGAVTVQLVLDGQVLDTRTVSIVDGKINDLSRDLAGQRRS